MFSMLTRLWHHGIALLLPHQCPGCQAYLPPSGSLAFCATCYAKLPWWNPARLLPPKKPRTLASFQAPLLYEDPLRQTLLAFKFEDATHLAPLLAKLLLPYLATYPGATLVPVPMHPHSLRQRTYNHTALLVQELSRLSGLPCDCLALRRIKKGHAQHTLSRAGRLKLSRSSFHCAPHLNGKNVILIDDIFTTGATLGACAGALRAAGVATVHGLTLAYTPPA